jgi:hypothetical protein
MLAVSWKRWPDPLVDFGLELEAAREMALGKVFSRDVVLLHGPLPFETYAWCFRLFGPSLPAAFAVNLLVLAAATVAAYRLVARLAGHFAATSAGLFFLLVLAFGQYTSGGNYNWVSPYTAGSTWGLLFGLLMIETLTRYAETKKRVFLVASGLALGLCFLTKSEPFVASLLAAATFLALLFLRREEETRMRPGPAFIAGFLAAALAPPLFFFILYAGPSGPLGPREALRATLGPWPILLGSAASRMPLYREVMGTSDPGASLAALAKWALVDLAVFLPAFLAARWFPRRGAGVRAVLVLTLTATILFLSSTFRSNGWFDVARPLPVFLVVLLLVLLLSKEGSPVPFFPVFVFAVFSLALLAKMALATRLTYYGFTLTMPASILAVAALTGLVPQAMTARGDDGRVFRLYACAVLAVTAGVYLANSLYRFSDRTCEVGAGPNRFLADGRGCFVQQALGEIGRRIAPDETLAVLPEGAMVNFLARRSNPTPYLNFMPLEIAVFGEERMLAAYRAHPPDWILLVHRDASEFGLRFFGVDYAKDFAAWIVESYEDTLLLGDPPFEGPYFGMRLLRRRSAR